MSYRAEVPAATDLGRSLVLAGTGFTVFVLLPAVLLMVEGKAPARADQPLSAPDVTAAAGAGIGAVTGHTDATGSETYNLGLSERRARADGLAPLIEDLAYPLLARSLCMW